MKSISLTQGKVALVDDGDFDWLNQWKWSVNRSSSKMYAVTWGKRNAVSMHRVILGDACEGMDVDHIDGDGLNNQRSNLRVCTRGDNSRNRKKSNQNNYQYKGVFPIGRKWRAVISVNGKTTHLGMFDNAEDAARAYDIKAKELYGEFANLNFG
jgi:AP2 domain.